MAVLPTGIGPVTGYNIERSLRFNSADSAYLNRTPASATNQKTWTWSAWVKRSALGSSEYLFSAGTGGTDTTQQGMYFDTGNTLRWTSALTLYLATTQVFRDTSAWYHIVFVFDTTQATANNRQRIYVNGIEITAFSTQVNPTQNLDYAVNQAAAFNIGRYTGASNYFNGYLTEINFVDSPVLVGSTTNASTTVTLTTGTTTNIGIGSNVGGTNIPSGATVSSITNSTTFVISSAATGTGSSISIGVTPPVTAFGETDSNTGVWKPKKYDGTYGTNGFYLKFADNSNTTAATLGKDSSGNGNNWTPNNFSVTAGTGNDSLVDTPTSYGTDTGVGGEVRGNYCTWNALKNSTTLSDGNLRSFNSSTTQWLGVVGTFGMTSGKWYWEYTPTVAATVIVGLANSSYSTGGHPGSDANSWGYYSANGNKYFNNSASSYGATYTANDVIGVAFDADAGTLTFYKNGVSQGTAYSSLTSGPYFPAVGVLNSQILFINAGQRPFEKWNGSAYVANTAPSGFKALCTQNLPTPTIGATSTTQANDYFNALIYTGNGTDGRTVTGVGFNPDLVWVKGRSDAGAHVWADAVRGSNKNLYSNLTDAETNPITGASGGGIGTVTTDGFVLEQGTVNMDLVNTNTRTYVAWNWNAGGSNQTISVGQYATSPANVPSIASTVRANTTSGFSIVTASASGTSPVTVGHGLGVTPSLIIGKVRDVASTNWYVYSASFAASDYLVLNSAAAKATSSNIWDIAPTSTVFTVGNPQNGWAGGNSGTKTYVFYCFAPVAGYSAFGSYAGNGTTTGDGPFIYTGFRPAFVMLKAYIGSGENWAIYDKSRIGYNSSNYVLFPNLPNIENAATTHIDLLSNGFKLRSGNQNLSSYSYIYAAFAEHPFKYSLAR